ncbi:hypothetical protein Cgig2_020180 [Carnegiea gigantea]|uniref:Reverse transcriptase zinc-binding domain-containing protein n=1 Tax=Carnegiea gigantea TaxID=171969 RepID=A0A9Q1KX68_9CARY|nr:hypothetical protein Cgig2_020180 [Carnegiea gigantea]
MKNVKRMHRNLTADTSCKKCGMEEESTLHLLRDCEAATRIWKQLVLVKYHATFFTLQLRDWMMLNLKQTRATKHKWPMMFATTVWWLWRWRNIRCFENPAFEPQRPCSNPLTFREGHFSPIHYLYHSIFFNTNSETPMLPLLINARKLDTVSWIPGTLTRRTRMPEGWVQVHAPSKRSLHDQAGARKASSQGCDIDIFKPRIDTSNGTWHGILENSQFIKHAVRMEIGNEKILNFGTRLG